MNSGNLPVEWPAVEEIIAAAAAKVGRKFRHWVVRDDVAQELRLWLLESEPRMGWAVDMVTPTVDGDGELDSETDTVNRRQLRTGLVKKAERYARSEKAAACGYEPADEWFYSTPRVAALVGVMLDGGVAAVTPDVGEKVTSGADSAEGGNLDAMLRDVADVWDVLPNRDRKVLVARHAGGTLEQAKRLLGVDVDTATVWRWEQKALMRMVDGLGGTTPWVKTAAAS